MVRIYVAALTVVLAFSASCSATSPLTLAKATPVTANGSGGRAQGRLRAHTTTNVEIDERSISDVIYAIARQVADHRSNLVQAPKRTYTTYLATLDLSLDKVLEQNWSELRLLYVKQTKRKRPKDFVSMYELLVKKYGLLKLTDMMKKPDYISLSETDNFKYLYDEASVYWRKNSVLKQYASELYDSKGNSKTFDVTDFESLQPFFERIGRRGDYLEITAAEHEKWKTNKLRPT